MRLQQLKVGQAHESSFLLSPQRVAAFADATEDRNPIHLDAAYAATTRFGRPIVHGMLLLGAVSRVLGTQFPGPGTVYVAQEARFLRPVFVGSDVLVGLVVEHVDGATRHARLRTEVRDADGVVCVAGTAEVYLPKEAFP